MIKDQKLTHAEARAVARCALKVLDKFNFPIDLRLTLRYCFLCISARGVAHYDRSFYADFILKSIEKWQWLEEHEAFNNDSI